MMAETNDGVFDPVEDIIGDIRAGKLVIITDDEDRENEGDLIGAAELMTPEMVNFMITEGRGMLCAPVSEGIAATLRLGPMVAQNRDTFRTNYTVTVDAARGVTTGVSAFDRAHTIRTLADPASTAGDLVQPGHVNPLVARPGGLPAFTFVEEYFGQLHSGARARVWNAATGAAGGRGFDVWQC